MQYLLLPVVNSSQESLTESKSWKCGFELDVEECALNLPGEPTLAQLTDENEANCQRRAELRRELETLYGTSTGSTASQSECEDVLIMARARCETMGMLWACYGSEHG